MAATDIRITILVDNRAMEGLMEEHGFSAWLEVSGQRILFDTGQGKALFHNAAMLGCELKRTGSLVLSHGHYDHCGAAAEIVRLAPDADVVCHCNAFLPRYVIHPGAPTRLISMPLPTAKALFDLPDSRISWVNGPQMLADGVGISGPIARLHPLEDTGGPFFLDQEGIQPDPIRDDMSLWLDSGSGLIVVTGCCHAGLINTVEQIRQESGVEKVRGIIGGLHLADASDERLRATCRVLGEWGTEFVIPCHCSGERAQSFLQRESGAEVSPGYAGLELAL